MLMNHDVHYLIFSIELVISFFVQYECIMVLSSHHDDFVYKYILISSDINYLIGYTAILTSQRHVILDPITT